MLNTAINKCLELVDTMMKAFENARDNEKRIWFQTYMPQVRNVFDRIKPFTMSSS